MNSDRNFSLSARRRSFAHAFRGIASLIASQHNAWIHAAATIAVVAAGLLLAVDRFEWICLVLAISAVWAAEAMNTAVELLGDAVTGESHPLVGRAKDVAAGAVLLTAGGAVVVALLVFVPRLLGALR